MRYSLFQFLLLIFLFSQPLEAFQQEFESFVILTTNEKRFGEINSDNLDQHGSILFRTGATSFSSYKAKDILGFSVDGKQVLKSISIEHISSKGILQKREFFTKELVAGTVSILEVYGATFEHALLKFDEAKALQRQRVESATRVEFFDIYQGIFYQLFRECKAIKTSKIDFHLSDYISAVNKYNKCVDPKFEEVTLNREKKNQQEFEVKLGNTTSSITGSNLADVNIDYEESSKQMLSIIYKTNFIHKNIFFGFGFERVKFNFDNKTPLIRGISYSEVRIPVMLEFRRSLDILNLSVITGFNYHTKIRDLETDNYTSLFAGLSAGLELSESLDFGISLSAINRMNFEELETEFRQEFNFNYERMTHFLLDIKFLDTNFKVTDTHSHIYLPDFDEDRDMVMNRAVEAGVKRILMPAIDFNSIAQMEELSNDQIEFHKMMGIHPCDVKEKMPNLEDRLFEFCSGENIIGIGETGLDYYWSTDLVLQQKASLHIHCKVAKETKKPIILHNRESTTDLLDLIEDEQDGRLKGIWHCFNGTVDEGKRALDLGLYLGIGGVVTFKNGGVDKTVAELPLNKMVLETDAPYLSPTPKRGKRNEPSFMKFTAQKLAEIFEATFEEIVLVTNRNTDLLFNI